MKPFKLHVQYCDCEDNLVTILVCIASPRGESLKMIAESRHLVYGLCVCAQRNVLK